MRRRAPPGMKTVAQRRASAKPVSSAVLLIQDVGPGNAGSQGLHTTGPSMTLKFSGETIATPQLVISVPFNIALEAAKL